MTHYEPKSQAAESFRALRTNLQFLRMELEGQALPDHQLLRAGGQDPQCGQPGAQHGPGRQQGPAGGRRPAQAERPPGVRAAARAGRHRLRARQLLTGSEVVGTISDVMLGDFAIEDILQHPGHGQPARADGRHQAAQPDRDPELRALPPVPRRRRGSPTTTSSWTPRRSCRSPTPPRSRPRWTGCCSSTRSAGSAAGCSSAPSPTSTTWRPRSWGSC
ncbi:MAG: hypothetical protein MZV70_06255 [Desulfobacterales bacterium]|nr:hypothetical protein [Desulfobacterales bacterium]